MSVLVRDWDQGNDLRPHQRPLSQHLGHDLATVVRHDVSGKEKGGVGRDLPSVSLQSEQLPDFFLHKVYVPMNCVCVCVRSPLLKDLQCEVQQLSLTLLPPLDHLQDGDGPAEVPAQLQHLLVGRLVVLAVLSGGRRR